MLRIIAAISLLACFTSAAAPKVQEVTLFDETRERPVTLRVWTDDVRACQDNNGFDDAPLLVFSHGAFGSPREYNWLAFALVSQGWNVIAPAHYGESWIYGRETINSGYASRFDLRIQDIHFLLSQLDHLPGVSNSPTRNWLH